MLVAVAVEDEPQSLQVIRLLQGVDGSDLERAEGNIRAGDWIDFDPLSQPQPVNA